MTTNITSTNAVTTGSHRRFYLGPLALANPLVMASSPATEDRSRLNRCADGGAAAAILKSCHTVGWTPSGKKTCGRRFEKTRDGLWGTSTIARELLLPDEALILLDAARRDFAMPVIPSIAGHTLDPEPWAETLALFDPLHPGCVQLDFFYLNEDLSLPASLERLRNLMLALRRSSPLPLLPKLNQELRPGAALASIGDSSICGWSVLDSLRFVVPPSEYGHPSFPLFSHAPPTPSASLFGAVELPATVDYLSRLRQCTNKPILAGGGVISVEDCLLLLRMGASAIQVATAVLHGGATWIRRVVTEITERLQTMGGQQSPSTTSRHYRICDDACHNCGRCAEQMMCSAICVHDGRPGINPDRCEGCGFCAGLCPVGAIVGEP